MSLLDYYLTVGRLGILALLGKGPVGRSMEVYPDDTFLVSYMRSGITWTRFMVGNLLSPDQAVTFKNIDKKIPEIYLATRKELYQQPRPRVIQCHEPFDARLRNVIYVVRDPRDVAISYYYLKLKYRRIEEGLPLGKFVPRFIAGDVDPRESCGSWGQNVATWLVARLCTDRFLLLRYEDMLADPSGNLAKIASFLGIDASPARLSRAVELSSSDRMRKLESEQSRDWKMIKDSRQDIPFVRSAVSGGWKSKLPPELAAQIETAWWPIMKTLGYELTSEAASRKPQCFLDAETWQEMIANRASDRGPRKAAST